MENFREFPAGPDPFGRMWHVYFKYLQTAISIRHSDSVDVRFNLESGDERVEKTIVLHNADLRAHAQAKNRPIDDSWCSRIAMLKVRQAIETGEDMEKNYVLVSAREIEEFDSKIKKWEDEWVKTHAA